MWKSSEDKASLEVKVPSALQLLASVKDGSYGGGGGGAIFSLTKVKNHSDFALVFSTYP